MILIDAKGMGIFTLTALIIVNSQCALLPMVQSTKYNSSSRCYSSGAMGFQNGM